VTGRRPSFDTAGVAAATAPLTIRVLGPLDVERADAVLPIGSAMQRRLLAALVAARGEAVSTDRLVAALWGEAPPPSARNGLQSYVARLRRTLGDAEVIRSGPGGYALDVARVSVDAWTFQDLVRDARRALDTEPTGTVEALRAGLASWRGEAFGDAADGSARDAASRLADLRAEAVELLARAQLRAGDPVEALAVLAELPAGAELRESALLLRVDALALAGRLPEALEAVRSYRERLADELGLDASPVVDDAERRLLRGELGADRRADRGATRPGVPPLGHTPLPPPRVWTETVGRDADLARIASALGAARLVTLVGPGGVGKSRLASLIGHDRPDRGGWIDLAPVRRAEDVAPAFAEGLGLSVPPGTAVAEAIVDALAGSDALVIVDNCEHVLDPVAALVDAAFGRSTAHRGRLLATSRERLDVAGELVIQIAPLRVPRAEEATEDDPAVRLFLERLSAAGGQAVPPRDAAAVVAAVDGLPLAIELAAAQAASLPTDALVERLGDRLDVLVGSRRRHGERHRTLERVARWSYDLLPDSEQRLFRRLSVFPATFGLEDAERICSGAGLPDEQVAASLARLVDASMVVRLDDGRFRLLEPLQRFAAAQLESSGDAPVVRARQRDHALELAAQADAAVSGPDETDAIVAVEGALPDLRAVHARALEDGDLTTVARLTAHLYRFAYLQARSDVLLWGAALADEPAADVSATDRARALAAAATGAWLAGDLARALDLLAEAERSIVDGSVDEWGRITVAEVAGDVHLAAGQLDAAVAAFTTNRACAEAFGHAGLAANAEVGLAFVTFLRGDREAARLLARSGVERAAAAGSPSVLALAEYTLGEVLADEDPDAALAALARSRALAVAAGARFHEGLARTADVALRGRHGPPAEALPRYREALELWRDSGAQGPLLTVLRNLVVLLVRTGADEAALSIHAVTERLAGTPSYGDEARRLAAAVAAARERLGPASVDRAGELALVELRDAADLALAALTPMAAAGPGGPDGS
jgi:predicted ATPase/DNA-binding SARP family transcriptional activator